MTIRKKIILFVLSLIFVITAVSPRLLKAQDEDRKVVKVGWYDSSYNNIDEYGFRSGYAYEYQLKLSAYNGWTYEYVEGSWPELLHKLQTGEIDLMSDVSYTEEREEYMYFSSLPMGSEEYYLFVAPGYEQISAFDRTTLNGKKVGVSLDTYQARLFNEWVKDFEVDCNIVLLETTEDESLMMMESGELDAYVTVDS
ncbi:MAG: transporter substrate-binding domain-containing protein, partial [Erysipelotrichaceae bacterium]|nr:transporter substrate-binding domain-containing protein [Erysipelotrichaceae bacterium]